MFFLMMVLSSFPMEQNFLNSISSTLDYQVIDLFKWKLRFLIRYIEWRYNFWRRSFYLFDCFVILLRNIAENVILVLIFFLNLMIVRKNWIKMLTFSWPFDVFEDNFFWICISIPFIDKFTFSYCILTTY